MMRRLCSEKINDFESEVSTRHEERTWEILLQLANLDGASPSLEHRPPCFLIPLSILLANDQRPNMITLL